MAKRTGRRKQPARPVIEDLFERPPTSREELEARLRRTYVAEARSLLTDRLERGVLDPDQQDVLVDAFLILGIGRELEKLEELVADREIDLPTRSLALRVLALRALCLAGF